MEINSHADKPETLSFANYRNTTTNLSPEEYHTADGRKFVSSSSHSNGALSIPAFYSGVRFISETIAGLPKRVLRKKGKTRQVVDHALTPLISEQPNELVNAFYLWESVIGHAVVYGNGYAWIQRNPDGSPRELHVLHPFLVVPFRSAGRQWYALRDWNGNALKDVNGKPVTVAGRDMVHLRNWSEDGEVGTSVIELLAETFGIAKSLDTFLVSFFDKGAVVNLAVEAEKGLDQTDIDTLRYGIESNNVGRDNAHNVMILAGATAKNLTAPLKDFSYDVLKPASLDDVARALRIPPTTLYALGRATWANLEQLGTELVKYSLGSWVLKLELECNLKLLSKDERADGLYVKWNLDGLQRGDYQTRVSAGVQLVGNRLMTPNEWRALEDLEAYEGGDTFYGPLNMAAVGTDADVEETPTLPALETPAPVGDSEPVQDEPTPQNEAESNGEGFSKKFAKAFSHIASRSKTKQLKAFANNKKTGEAYESWLVDFANKQGVELGEELDPILSGLIGDVTSLSFALQSAVEDYTADVLKNKEAADPHAIVERVVAKLETK